VTTAADGVLPGSFRDPAGFLFRRGGVLYRQVNLGYRRHYERLVASGLYQHLTGQGLLCPHEEAAVAPAAEGALVVLKPEELPFVSYCYEWCFGQLRDAALATLQAQRAALERGMILKDASAYNVQFSDGRPVLIDTLSFEEHREGAPWAAYRQFCEHFLGPLALLSYRDVRLAQLLRSRLEGLPLDLVAPLLPARSRLRFGLLVHVHLHARSQAHFQRPDRQPRASAVSRRALLGMVDSLETAVRGLRPRARGSAWIDYEQTHAYSAAALAEKTRLVERAVTASLPGTVWDLGANTGLFSRLAARAGAYTVAFDSDPAVVEASYARGRADGETRLLPLVMDLSNPSPGNGWEGRERLSLEERGPADLVLALALVHHLAFSHNLSLAQIAGYFARLGAELVVEWVPKDDPQARRLLAGREDTFPGYTRDAFEAAFGRHRALAVSEDIAGSGRRLYHWKPRP
jgi:SAM-dependent methyltransferase